MPANASPEYAQAEKKFLAAQSDEDKLFFLEEMIKHAPAHKGGEALRANLKTRCKKLKEKMETKKKVSSGSGGKQGIKKEDMQFAIVGFPNVGKSTIFNLLTGQNSFVSEVPFSTIRIEIGMTKYEDVQMQTIDLAPFPNADKSTINTTDTLLIVIDNLSQITEVDKFFLRADAKKIYLYNKVDLLNEAEKRKLEATIKSKFKRLNFILFSGKDSSKEDLNELKKKIFQTFPIIRVYTKEPKKEASKTPMILERNSELEDVAEKILNGMAKKIRKARIWGPSSKFPGQTIGLEHVLKDKDIVEFQTE